MSAYGYVAPLPEDLRTPVEWCEETGWAVMDADGWQGGFECDGVTYGPRDWEEPISLTEFMARLPASTTRPPRDRFRRRPIRVRAKQLDSGSLDRISAVSTWLDRYGIPHTIDLSAGPPLVLHDQGFGSWFVTVGSWIVLEVTTDLAPRSVMVYDNGAFNSMYEVDQ